MKNVYIILGTPKSIADFSTSVNIVIKNTMIGQKTKLSDVVDYYFYDVFQNISTVDATKYTGFVLSCEKLSETKIKLVVEDDDCEQTKKMVALISNKILFGGLKLIASAI